MALSSQTCEIILCVEYKVNEIFVILLVFRWDETSEESESMEPSNSENEQVSEYNRRPRRQAAVATKRKQQNKSNKSRRKKYSSDDDSDYDDDQKR